MKKQLGLFAFIVLVSISCRDNTVFEAYQEFNKTWYVKQVTGLPVVQKEVKFIDFSKCNVSKKLARSEGQGCFVPINSFEREGLSVEYTVVPDNVVNIRQAFTVPSEIPDGVTKVVPTQLENDLTAELKGSWSYVIEGNVMTLKSGEKSIVFNL